MCGVGWGLKGHSSQDRPQGWKMIFMRLDMVRPNLMISASGVRHL